MLGAGAGNPWDIAGNFIPVMGTYGLTAGMWFCPARPEEMTAAVQYYNNNRAITSLTDITNYAASLVSGVYVINHNSGSPAVRVSGRCLTRITSSQYRSRAPWLPKNNTGSRQPTVFLSSAIPASLATARPGDAQVKNININTMSNFPKAKKYSGQRVKPAILFVNDGLRDGHVELHKQGENPSVSGWIQISRPASFIDGCGDG